MAHMSFMDLPMFGLALALYTILLLSCVNLQPTLSKEKVNNTHYFIIEYYIWDLELQSIQEIKYLAYILEQVSDIGYLFYMP